MTEDTMAMIINIIIISWYNYISLDNIYHLLVLIKTHPGLIYGWHLQNGRESML